jgi:hypothetical protein
MKFRIEVICVSEDGAEQRSEVRAIERQVAIIGTGREGLAFVVLSLRSTRRRCPSFVLILALRVYAERRAELNER